jgi:Protein of unknown function (DUF2637)
VSARRRWRRPGAAALIKWSSAAALVAGAGVVAWISYIHAVDVIRWAGETGAIAYLYPVTIDGLIYVASMVMLDCARRGESSPGLARTMLVLGIGATVLANFTAGYPYPRTFQGAVRLWAFCWPAPVVILMYELMMMLVRRRAAASPASSTAASSAAAAAPDPADVPAMRQQRRPVGTRRRAPSPAAAASNGGARV